MAILVYGSLNIDRTFLIPHWIQAGETLHSMDFTIHAGGKGANQAVAIAKAGGDVYLAGTVGEDGHWLISQLNKYAVKTRFIGVNQNGKTGTATILVDTAGQNGIVLYGGCNQEQTQESIDAVFDNFSQGDWLVLQNEINNIPYICEKALAKGMRVCFNPSPMEDELLNLPLDCFELLVVNEIEGGQLVHTAGTYDETLALLNSRYPKTRILLTAGSKGAYYAYRNVRHYCPAVHTPVVDTTAAGDTFLGYFLTAITRCDTIPDAMELAARAAAVTISRKGAMESIPMAAELSE